MDNSATPAEVGSSEWLGQLPAHDLTTDMHCEDEGEPAYSETLVRRVIARAVADERERCAKLVEQASTKGYGYIEGAGDLRDALAAMIRKA